MKIYTAFFSWGNTGKDVYLKEDVTTRDAKIKAFYLNAGGESLESRIGILAYFIQGILGACILIALFLFLAVMLVLFSDVVYPLFWTLPIAIFWTLPIAIGKYIFGIEKEIKTSKLTYIDRHP